MPIDHMVGLTPENNNVDRVLGWMLRPAAGWTVWTRCKRRRTRIDSISVLMPTDAIN